MRTMPQWFGVLSLALLASCGGGGSSDESGGGGGGSGGNGSTQISASPTALTFRFDAETTADPQAIDVSYVGDGVVVGYPPGGSEPAWLSVSTLYQTPERAQFSIAVDRTRLPALGRYNTTLRFATGRLTSSGRIEDARDVRNADVPVTLSISDFSVLPRSLSYAVIDGGSGDPLPLDQRTLNIAGSSLNWTASSDAAWLTLNSTSGTRATALRLAFATQTLALGTHTAHITVRNTSTGDEAVVPVTLVKRLPRLTVTPGSFSFTVDQKTEPPALLLNLRISDELSGTDASRAVSWSLRSSGAPWLKLSATGGSSVPSAAATLSVDAEQLTQIANGEHTAELVLSYSNREVTDAVLVVPVQLQLKLPRVSAIAPYLMIVPTSRDATLRGLAFAGADLSKLRIGSQTPSTFRQLSDTELRLRAPVLPAGRYPVEITNALGVSTSRAELVVRDPVSYPYAAFPAGGFFGHTRIFFDAERATLYGVTGGRLDRFVYANGVWSQQPSFSVPGLADAGLSVDGKLLYTVGEAGLQSLDPEIGSSSLTTLSTININDGSSLYYSNVGVLNSRQVALMTDSRCCSGAFPGYLFNLDELVNEATRYTAPGRPVSRTLPDNNGVYIAESNGGGNAGFIRASDGIYQHAPFYPTATNGDGSRLTAIVTLPNNAERVRLFDASQNVLGDLGGDNQLSQPVLTADGREAILFGCVVDSSGDQGRTIRVANLAATPVNGIYPIVRTIKIPDEDPPYTLQQFGFPCRDIFESRAVSPDGRTGFISGSEHLVIVPLR